VIRIKPGFNFCEAEYYLGKNSLNPITVKNTGVYNKAKELTEGAFPSSQDKSEKRWDNFYLPLKRAGRKISIPFSVVKYRTDFASRRPECKEGEGLFGRFFQRNF